MKCKRIVTEVLALILTLAMAGCQGDVTDIEKETTTINKPEAAEEVITDGLRPYADEKHIHIGAAVQPFMLLEEDYSATLIANYNTLTAENHMKWETIHPEQATYDFTSGDAIVDFAKEHTMDVRGHALVWHIQNPAWLTEGTWTEEELWAILEDHIKTVVGHYKGEVYAWDVVNEMFENGFYRESLWYKTLGPDYIAQAIKWAHEADPEAKLYINDYSVEEVNIKSNAMYDLAQALLADGVPLDGVGFQFHINNDSPMDFISVYNNVKRFTELGLEVDFTEIDVRMSNPIVDGDYEKQAEAYKELMSLVVGMEGANNFTTWGLTDKYSWIPGFFTGYDHALLFDQDYNKKMAYDTIHELLSEDDFSLDYEARIEGLENNRSMLRPFDIKRLDKAPVLDGQIDESEYQEVIIHSFLYNQLSVTDATFNPDDISGSWRIGYHDNIMYGVVERRDDLTIVNHSTNYENDTVEVFVEHGPLFNQLRSLVGNDFESQPGEAMGQAVWNEAGTVMEFAIELPEEDLTGLTIGFNIALSDNDSASQGREVQLYPFFGHNASWSGKDLGNIMFEGDTPRPTEKIRLTPPLEVNKAYVAPIIDGVKAAGEWSEAMRMPLGYDQINPVDQRMAEKNDLSVDYQLSHFEGLIYGLVSREDDVLEQGDTITFAFERSGEWLEKEVQVGENIDSEGIHVVWGEAQKIAEFSVQVGDQLGIQNYSISSKDVDQGVLNHELHPHYNYGRSVEEGNYVELLLK